MSHFVPLLLTIYQTVWIALWAKLHLKIRKNRKYAGGRALVAVNKRYRILSMVLFAQNILCILFFWSNNPWLLKFHDGYELQVFGALLQSGATALYFWAIKHLGDSYSPCYDSHVPREIIITGPYRWIRHPMYLAKILIGLSQVLLTGSYWYIPAAIYLTMDTLKALRSEESYLPNHLPEYVAYRSRTARLLPFL